MTTTPEPAAAYPVPAPAAARPRPAALPMSQWVDQMVKRLRETFDEQMARVEAAAIDRKQDAADRARNARTLELMLRTLERLDSLERRRVALRARRKAAHDDDILGALERRLDQLAGAGDAPRLPSRPEER